MSHELIEHTDTLKVLLERWQTASVISVDTEFFRERTYFPKLCLLQMCWQQQPVAIDVVAIEDLSLLQDFINDQRRTKVFHSARQDLELLMHEWGQVPKPLFDTQVAADLVGEGDQSGYARLVEAVFGESLPKDVTRSNWCGRPLSDRQLAYAYSDVTWLEKLYHHLDERLEQTRRQAWMREEMLKLETESLHFVDPENAWLKLKGRNRLNPQQMTVLQKLAAWREQTAIQKDLPRKWVLGDGFLLEAAQHQPDSMRGLAALYGHDADKRQIERYAETLLDLINEGRQVPEQEWLHEQRRERLDGQQKKALALLEQRLETFSQDQQISMSIIASRRDLSRVVTTGSVEHLHGWRRSILEQLL